MANFLFGYHIGVMNGPIVSVARDLGFEGNSILEGLVVSIFIVGAFVGSIGSGYLVDNFGCRRTFQINAVPLIAGALLCAQAHSLDEILWGRFSVGLGIGANTVLVPIYISEVSPTRYRGSLGTICQIGTCLGIIASLLLGIPSDSTPDWWRTLLFIASIPAVIVMFGMQFAVESPRWLCKAGKWNDAKMVVSQIWGESQIDNAMKEIRSVVNLDGRDIEADWLELLQEPHNKGQREVTLILDRLLHHHHHTPHRLQVLQANIMVLEQPHISHQLLTTRVVRLAVGAIVGIVMGSLVVAVVVLVGLVLCLRKIPKGGHAKEIAISNSLEIRSLGSCDNVIFSFCAYLAANW